MAAKKMKASKKKAGKKAGGKAGMKTSAALKNKTAEEECRRGRGRKGGRDRSKARRGDPRETG